MQRIKLVICLLSLSFSLPSPFSISSAAAGIESTKEQEPDLRADFHPASSQNEKTLEYILDQASKHYDPASRYDYTNTSLTNGLLDAINDAQNYAIAHNCKGDETLGTVCGLKYNPVTCAANIPPIYYFRTENSDEYSATLFTSLDPEGKNASRYRMVYTDHEWKIDRITCANSDSFNEL